MKIRLKTFWGIFSAEAPPTSVRSNRQRVDGAQQQSRWLPPHFHPSLSVSPSLSTPHHHFLTRTSFLTSSSPRSLSVVSSRLPPLPHLITLTSLHLPLRSQLLTFTSFLSLFHLYFLILSSSKSPPHPHVLRHSPFLILTFSSSPPHTVTSSP